MSRRRARVALVFGAVAVACSAAGYLLLSSSEPGANPRRTDAKRVSSQTEPGRARTEETATAHEPPVAVSPLFDAHARFEAGETVPLRFRALDASGSPATSQALSVSISSASGGEGAPVVAREIGGGIYEVPFTPEDNGPFQMVVTSGGAAHPLASVRLQVGGEVQPAVGPVSSSEPGSDVEQTPEEQRRLRTYRLLRRGGRR